MPETEIQTKEQANPKEEKLPIIETVDIDLSAHQDLVELIKSNYPGKDIVPFQRIASDKIFGVDFVKFAVEHKASFQDITTIESFIDSMKAGGIELIKQEIDDLKQIIESPDNLNNVYKNLEEFKKAQEDETWSIEELVKTTNQEWLNEYGADNHREGYTLPLKDKLSEVNKIDADSINNILNELTMRDIEERMSVTHDKAVANSEYNSAFPGYPEELLTRLVSEKAQEKDKSKDSKNKNNKKLDTSKAETEDEKRYSKFKRLWEASHDDNFTKRYIGIDTNNDKFITALKEIQNVKTDSNESLYIPSQLPLFMIPGEIRTFMKQHADEELPIFKESLKNAMAESAKQVKDTSDSPEEKVLGKNVMPTVEILMQKKFPELSEKDKNIIIKYTESSFVSEAGRHYGGASEGRGIGGVEGLKGFFSMLAKIIEAIWGGFSNVWGDMSKDPSIKNAFNSLGVNNLDITYLKEKGTLTDDEAEVNTQVSKHFDPSKTDTFTQLMNEDQAIQNNLGQSVYDSKYYHFLRRCPVGTVSGKLIDNMLRRLHPEKGEMDKGDNKEAKKALLNTDGVSLNKTKVDDLYKTYKEYMLNIRAEQGVKVDLLNPAQKQEMFSRSLVKNNQAALLYYTTFKDTLKQPTATANNINKPITPSVNSPTPGKTEAKP